jgi:hypothetical protein
MEMRLTTLMQETSKKLNMDDKIDLIIYLIGECESDLPNTYAGDKEFEDYVRDIDDMVRGWKCFRERRQLMLDRNEISDPKEAI